MLKQVKSFPAIFMVENVVYMQKKNKKVSDFKKCETTESPRASFLTPHL